MGAINASRTKEQAGVVDEPGQAHTHRHHVFPQEKAAWFGERGVDVDEWCIDLTPTEHQAQHGGGSSRLARKVAREQPDAEWNAGIMTRLLRREAIKQRGAKGLNAELTPSEILEMVERFMKERGLDSQLFRRYVK